MKKNKILRNASLVALSAVMLCGTAFAAAGCGGGGSDYEISVNIFCNDLDAETNKKICDDWAAEYTETLKAEGKIPENEEIVVDFNYSTNSTVYFDDLKYDFVSNNAADVIYVSPKYVKSWSKIGRILDITDYIEKTDETISKIQDVWQDAISLYGCSQEATYTSGDAIAYNKETGKFETVDNNKTTVGLYGLPKDYSNFGLGFNNIFFSDAMRQAYTTTLATTPRKVTGAEFEAAKLTYTGSGDEEVVTDAVTHEACPIIQINKPTTYKPYNFYRYGSYSEALDAGDPVAAAVDEYTEGEGYTVTIPGWPGDTYTVTDESKKAENAAYDANSGYIVYTYQEFGALTWAVTYYLNTFAWSQTDATQGTGGVKNKVGSYTNVYGNDQYDGSLYLLPWLASNDANYINSSSTKVQNGSNPAAVGTETEKVSKLRLNGQREEVDVQYGTNSERFIETYGAFTAYNSDWNGSSNFADATEKVSGWDMFCGGSLVFYGAGTWDAATRNNTDLTYLQFRQMPEPVAEKYALYSVYKDANYEMQSVGTLKTYEAGSTEWEANMNARQDKWGARMDSVGYGVNGSMASLVGTDSEWKVYACVSLIQALTINVEAQKQLTYGGAQLPNFVSMTQDFLYYNDKNYSNYENGTFNDMITPDGDAAGNKVWDTYYAVVKEMYAARANGGTIGEWMAANHADLKYSADFKDVAMEKVNGYSFAMKVLNMTTFTKADRDLAIRMQTGLNAIRDPGVYTYDTRWLDALDGRGDYLLAYTTKDDKFVFSNVSMKDSVVTTPGITITTGSQYGTPAVWLLNTTKQAQEYLDDAIKEEQKALGA